MYVTVHAIVLYSDFKYNVSGLTQIGDLDHISNIEDRLRGERCNEHEIEKDKLDEDGEMLTLPGSFAALHTQLSPLPCEVSHTLVSEPTFGCNKKRGAKMGFIVGDQRLIEKIH